ncbi:MAG: magnesium transporter MgtE N-terminal domain-containing protein [Myxococcota bacterium]
MAIENELARRVLAAHPAEAARVLEALPASASADLFAGGDAEAAAACLGAMLAPRAAEVLNELPLERAAEVLAPLTLDATAALLRRLGDERREALLAETGGRRARSLRSLLRFAPGTAGALMDPEVLALPADLAVNEAIARVRETPAQARYNVYVVDREQHLAGAVNLRELFLADPTALLSSIAHRPRHRLLATADRHAIVSHPGWREVHALPVVDRAGTYLGALRYRTLRRLDEELHGTRPDVGATSRALGDLFRTGASSVLDALASAGPAPGGSRGSDGA